jgi:choline dehydrogenase-like flavoprotein
VILDARQICHGQLLRADLCIVGAGAAGIALALQFVDSEFAVLLLESGGEQPDAAIASLNEGHVADPALHPPPARFRRRGLGGSTRIWGGRCVPLDDIDFERRAWIGHSGWPIGPDALSGFYPAANRLCEAGAFAYRARDAFPQGMAPLIEGFRGTRFTDSGLERFSCPTDFGRRYRARLEGDRLLRLVLHATVTRLRCAADGGRVEMLTAQTITGRAFSVRATHFVLAMGGLEIPRLLLASCAVHANGIGNLGDAVGRFYMCHIAGSAGRLRPSAGTQGIHHGYQIAADGTYCRRRLALTPAAQRELGTGNIILRLHHPRIADPGHGSGALSALCLARPFILPEYRTRLRDPSPDG